MTNDMTKGNSLKLILLFSIPLMIGNIFQQLYNMVDTIIVGRSMGQAALAAVGCTSSLVFLVNGFIQGITCGFAVLVSQKFGKKDEAGLRKAVASALILSVFAIIIITLISVLGAKPLLRLMNTPDSLMSDASTYIIILYAGTIAIYFYNILAAILRALGDSKTPLYFLIISSVLNIILDLVFILVFNMGVAGAAYATVVSQGVSALLCLVYTYRRYDILKLKKEDFNFKSHYYTRHLKVGIPMGLQFSITAIGIMTVQSAINIFGETYIASYSAASKVFNLVMQPPNAIGATMATYCGQNIGAKRPDRIKKGVRQAELISVVISIIAAFVLVVLGKYFVMMFASDVTQEMLDHAQVVLNYSAIFFIPLSLIFVYRNALQGMGESFIPMMAGVFELIARAVVAFTLPATLGFVGICLSDPVAWIAAAVPLGITFYIKIRKLLYRQEHKYINEEI